MVAAGSSHSLALRQDGTVWAWGLNDYGQIGGAYYTYGTAYFTTPIQVYSGSPLSNVVSIAAGGLNSYAIKSDGTDLGVGDTINTGSWGADI